MTPHPANNVVTVRIFPAQSTQRRHESGKAVVVLPQWNSNAEGHVGLCRLLARFGVTALRLSLPYHDRAPSDPSSQRAEYIVSSNVGRTLHANRQAVLDAKRAIDWLASRGLRPDRRARHQSRIVPVDAHDGARPARARGRVQPHLALLRRRRLARAVHATRALAASTAISRSTSCASTGCRSARGRSSNRMRGRRRSCSSTRVTT